MNCPPTSAGRGIGPETRLCHLSAMHLRMSRGSIALCLYPRCRVKINHHHNRPSHSSRFHRATMSKDLCLWRCHLRRRLGEDGPTRGALNAPSAVISTSATSAALIASRCFMWKATAARVGAGCAERVGYGTGGDATRTSTQRGPPAAAAGRHPGRSAPCKAHRAARSGARANRAAFGRARGPPARSRADGGPPAAAGRHTHEHPTWAPDGR